MFWEIDGGAAQAKACEAGEAGEAATAAKPDNYPQRLPPTTAKTGGRVKVIVDPDICQGHARCWEICPEVFNLDEEGHSQAIDGEVPTALEEKVAEAVANCPERAISLT
jgi:ferredoxin